MKNALYNYIVDKMHRHSHKNKQGITYIFNSEVKYVLSCQKIPHDLQTLVIKDLIDLSLLERIDKFKYKLKKPNTQNEPEHHQRINWFE